MLAKDELDLLFILLFVCDRTPKMPDGQPGRTAFNRETAKAIGATDEEEVVRCEATA